LRHRRGTVHPGHAVSPPSCALSHSATWIFLATDYEESSYAQFGGQIANARYSRKDIFWVPQEQRDQYFQATEDPEVFQLTMELGNGSATFSMTC